MVLLEIAEKPIHYIADSLKDWKTAAQGEMDIETRFLVETITSLLHILGRNLQKTFPIYALPHEAKQQFILGTNYLKSLEMYYNLLQEKAQANKEHRLMQLLFANYQEVMRIMRTILTQLKFLTDKENAPSIMEYAGSLDEESANEMMEAVLEYRKLDKKNIEYGRD